MQTKSRVIKAGPKSTGVGPRVIAVTSGKGGVGKSNITVNLAMALSDLGQRVVIFDADLGLANIEVLLGLKPRYTLYDFLYNGKTITEIISPGPQNVSLISGGAGFMELANLDAESLQSLQDAMQVLESNVDIVLVDTGAGLNKNVLAFVAAAHELIVVVTPEPTSITDAYGLIKVVANYNVHQEINIIVNRVLNKQEADSTISKLQITATHFLPHITINPLGSVPDDKAVVQAVKEQTPFVLYSPHSKAAGAVKKMADRLMGVEKEGKGAGGLSKFFNRLTRLFG